MTADLPDRGWTWESWLAALAEGLEIELDTEREVPVDDLLDLTREVAHGVARPAAPLTLYLLGWAAARRGGGADDVAAVLATARALATGPAPDADPRPDADIPDADGTDADTRA